MDVDNSWTTDERNLLSLHLNMPMIIQIFLKVIFIQSRNLMMKLHLFLWIQHFEEKQKPQEKIVEEKIEERELRYSIQVASYSRKDIALEEVDTLKKKGHDPFLIQKGQYVALCVGRFATKEEATTIAKNLKARYSDCFVRKL